MVESDSKATVQETKKRKRPTVYSSDDSEEEKSDIEEQKRKKTTPLRVAVTSFQTVNPNTNESFGTKTQTVTGGGILGCLPILGIFYLGISKLRYFV